MLTVLFAPLDYHGHINACHGIAETLRDRGHKIVFAIDMGFAGRLSAYGFDEELLEVQLPHNSDDPDMDPVSAEVMKYKDVFKEGSLAMTEKFCSTGFGIMARTLMKKDEQYKEIIARIKPDLIVIDSYIGCPTLTDSGIPWVWLYSAAPLMAWNSENLPPPWSGFPTESDPTEWQDYLEKFSGIFDNLHNMVSSWYAEAGAPSLPSSALVLHPRSQYLNIYMYPKELEYKEKTENWERVDGFVRTTGQTFEMPEFLRQRSGKLVFLSMGSIGCSHIELMSRLVQILSKSEHKFIVATGPLHKKYSLSDNMWGQPFVPQTAVLPEVDLVITHGGNNTVTETFFYGKPMIVMPLFGDQYENAQRIHEKGLGIRLNPFHCSEEELLSSIDRLVNDCELKAKMKAIGERIRSNEDKQMIADRIEKIVQQMKK